MFNKKRSLLLLISLLVTFVVMRISLHLSPSSNFNVGAYNIHHLFTGVLLMLLAGLPLILFDGNGPKLDFSTLVFGAGLGMTLDEWVYLITTDGSDAAYLLPLSLWGAIVMITLAVLYVLLLYTIGKHSRTNRQ